jgi:hypothetical protein
MYIPCINLLLEYTWYIHGVYHMYFFTADPQYQEELKKDNVVYPLPICAAAFGSQTAPETFLKLLRLDWVAQQEGKCGAAGAKSASYQIAGLPSQEGCFVVYTM